MSTLHPALHILPPTDNTMDPDQRARLVRTARKLEALLGTTPQVVQSGFSSRARRRNVGFRSPFSSSVSSLDSNSSEETHPRPGVSTDSQRGRAASSPSTSQKSPSSWRDDTFNEKKIKKKKGGPQPLAQPLLLRMSAVPVDHHCRRSSIAGTSTGTAAPIPTRANHVLTPIHVPAPPLVTPFERRQLKVDSILGPLSPINTFHFPTQTLPSHSDLDFPASPSSDQDVTSRFPPRGLSDREKRIKMAKLQRMMGENIPPELVFRETASAVEKTAKTLKRSSRSMTSLKTPNSDEQVERKTKRKGADIVRPLPNVPISHTPSRSLPSPPRQAPIITRTTTITTSSPLIRQTSLSMQRKGRKSRPRSLTLGTDSAFVAANIKLAKQEKEVLEAAETASAEATRSLDEESRWRLHRDDHAKKDRKSGKAKIQGVVVETELWRRKEREWSGEWNVKDMTEVAKALRGLKAA